MPFIPHSTGDVQDMLATIGVAGIDALFDEIPVAIRAKGLTQTPPGISELEILQIMQERAARIGATVFVHSAPGQGCHVVLSLPAHPVSGVNSGAMHLDAGALAALERAA